MKGGDLLSVSTRLVWSVLLFSAFAVWGLWNLFSIGVFALGLNFTVFWIGMAIIFFVVDPSYRITKDWVWLFPILLIILSYSLYENPWLKWVSFFSLPVIVGTFCAYSHFRHRKNIRWNFQFFLAVVSRWFKPLSVVSASTAAVLNRNQFPFDLSTTSPIRRILLGLLFLIPLSVLVTLLLASADQAFREIVLETLHTAFLVVSWLSLWKLFVSVLLAIALLSAAIGWSGVMEYAESKDEKRIDGLVAGIVLGGLLLIYVAFLSLQFDTLMIEQLPENYHLAETMVKSGFWQLFVLAVLNTGLFFVVYRKTGKLAQWILRVFIVASSLLMVSAAWKVGLYSYTFGLSYEKFFACYTAVFSLGVLLYLVFASFSIKRRNVVKTIAFSALWCYAVATVNPVEKIIFHANLYFSEQANTRVTLTQLTQLSMDIMNDVDKVYAKKLALNSSDMGEWRQWRSEQKNTYCQRAWYEKNMTVFLACP